MLGGPIFFRFNKWDWGIAIGATTLVLAIFLGLNSLLIDNKLNGIRVDFARLETNAGHHQGTVLKAFADHRAEVNTLIQAGLTERTDEVQRALIAGADQQQWFSVKVANVPAGGDTFTALKTLALNFDAPMMMEFGDKVAFEFYVSELDDPKAAMLQSALIDAQRTGVATAISISSGPSSFK